MLRRLLFSNFRFVFRLSQWTLHRFTPAGMLVLGGMVSAGVFGIDTRQSLAFQIFAITASLLLLSILNAFTFRGHFRINRRLPEFGTVGQPLKYKLIIDNLDNRHQQELLVFDELATTLPTFREFIESDDPQDRNRNWFDRMVGYPRLMGLIRKKRGAFITPVEIDDITAADRSEISVELLPVRRGYLHFARSRLARSDPFGLFRAMQGEPNNDALLILPKTYRIPPVQLRGTRKYQRGGMNLASTVGDSQEFMSLRDYRPGDPLRAIHWRSYARTGQPVVKEFQDEYFVRQGLILDTFIEDKSEEIFEEAVSVAASFIISLRQQDSLLDLMFIGTESYRFTAGRGLSKTENMLEILACVEPCHERAFNKLNELILRHASEMSGLLCLFLDWDEKRREVVQGLIAMGIPVLVFVLTVEQHVTPWDPGPMAGQPQHFIVLPMGRIQEKLDQENSLGDVL
ncbi:MAG: DUF58 domain-containing protein [Gammaproteobacteria bacterium]